MGVLNAATRPARGDWRFPSEALGQDVAVAGSPADRQVGQRPRDRGEVRPQFSVPPPCPSRPLDVSRRSNARGPARMPMAEPGRGWGPIPGPTPGSPAAAAPRQDQNAPSQASSVNASRPT